MAQVRKLALLMYYNGKEEERGRRIKKRGEADEEKQYIRKEFTEIRK